MSLIRRDRESEVDYVSRLLKSDLIKLPSSAFWDISRNDELLIKYFRDIGLFKKYFSCPTCGRELEFGDSDYKAAITCDGYLETDKGELVICGKEYKMLKGTIFQGVHKHIGLLGRFFYTYLVNIPPYRQILKTNVALAPATKAKWRKKYLAVLECAFKQYQDEDFVKLPGPVEIDESYFYRRWLVGGICRTTDRTFFHWVSSRTKSVMHSIILKYVQPGATVYTDHFLSYFGIDLLGFNHRCLNKKRDGYIDPDDSNNNTQKIERLWQEVRRNLPKNRGSSSLDQVIAEYWFKRQHKDERLVEFFKLCAIYHPFEV